jgi:hypothetical protein
VSKLRYEYFRTLGVDRSDGAARPKLEAALKRAYQLRNFEIEHYWKRATYFWGFQIAIFAAFGLLWKEITASDAGTNAIINGGTSTVTNAAINEWGPVALALAGLGILTAVANALSARGSRFWQDNWEKHIDMLEDGIEGRLYKTVWLYKGKVSFSVSRVNLSLSHYFIVFWVLVGYYVAWKYAGWPPLERKYYVLAVIIMIALGAGSLSCQRTNLEGAQPSRDDEPIERRSRWNGRIRGAAKYPTFIRRYAPDEELSPRRGRWRRRIIFIVTLVLVGVLAAMSSPAVG